MSCKGILWKHKFLLLLFWIWSHNAYIKSLGLMLCRRSIWESPSKMMVGQQPGLKIIRVWHKAGFFLHLYRTLEKSRGPSGVRLQAEVHFAIAMGQVRVTKKTNCSRLGTMIWRQLEKNHLSQKSCLWPSGSGLEGVARKRQQETL